MIGMAVCYSVPFFVLSNKSAPAKPNTMTTRNTNLWQNDISKYLEIKANDAVHHIDRHLDRKTDSTEALLEYFRDIMCKNRSLTCVAK